MNTDILIAHARIYLAAGFSILRTDGKKTPIGAWKPLMKNAVADADLETYIAGSDMKWDHAAIAGLGIITGAVSGNLEVIDVDTKHSTNPDLFEDLAQAITDLDDTLLQRLTMARTPSGGYHLYYRCPSVQIPGNHALARRETSEPERVATPTLKIATFIETRGEGGYVAAVPTEGYAFEQGDISTVPVITEAERDTIIAAVMSLNEYTPVYTHHEPASVTKAFGKSPLDDYNERGDVVALLIKHQWTVVRQVNEKTFMKRPGSSDAKTSGDYHRGKNLFSVFTTSTIFEAQKGYKPAAVYAFLEHAGDFKAAARALLEDGFGTRRKAIDRKVEEVIRTARDRGQEGPELLSTVALAADCSDDEARRMVDDYENNAGADVRTFWSVNPKTLKPAIMLTKLEAFLAQGGYGLYFYNDNRTIFKIIRNDHGIVEEVSTENIKKYVKDYVESLPGNFDDITRDDLLEVVYRTKSFNEGFFEYLPRLELNFLKDTKDVAYYPFRNGVAEVKKTGIELKSYGELGKCVWRSQIILHDLDIAGDDLEPSDIEFFRFIKAVCGGYSHPEAEHLPRIEYMMQTAGYLLHGYKDPAASYCVVLAEETDDESKGGGTGKGIFFKALGKLVPQLVMDGKNFKLDKSFAFQRVQLDHRLVVIDDVRTRLDFEGFYSMITEGFTIEKKNKDELYIPYKDAPKIIFATNYAIPAAADHAKRRQRVIEFFKHFTPAHTPKDEFGHNLFDDWDEAEWNRFYNLLFSCVQAYLLSGLPARETSEASKKKQIKQQFGDEFFSWFHDYLVDRAGETLFFNELRTNFLSAYDIEAKDYSAKRFKKGLEIASELTGHDMVSRTNRQTGNKIEITITRRGESAHDLPAAEPNPF